MYQRGLCIRVLPILSYPGYSPVLPLVIVTIATISMTLIFVLLNIDGD